MKREGFFLVFVRYVGDLNCKVSPWLRLCNYLAVLLTNCYSLFKPHIVIAVASSLFNVAVCSLVAFLLRKVKLLFFSYVRGSATE